MQRQPQSFIRHRNENECRDVAVLRLYKVSGRRIFQFGRCLLVIADKTSFKPKVSKNETY
jgi:hypothetical protein